MRWQSQPAGWLVPHLVTAGKVSCCMSDAEPGEQPLRKHLLICIVCFPFLLGPRLYVDLHILLSPLALRPLLDRDARQQGLPESLTAARNVQHQGESALQFEGDMCGCRELRIAAAGQQCRLAAPPERNAVIEVGAADQRTHVERAS